MNLSQLPDYATVISIPNPFLELPGCDITTNAGYANALGHALQMLRRNMTPKLEIGQEALEEPTSRFTNALDVALSGETIFQNPGITSHLFRPKEARIQRAGFRLSNAERINQEISEDGWVPLDALTMAMVFAYDTWGLPNQILTMLQMLAPVNLLVPGTFCTVGTPAGDKTRQLAFTVWPPPHGKTNATVEFNATIPRTTSVAWACPPHPMLPQVCFLD